jgi:hypothetical protein
VITDDDDNCYKTAESNFEQTFVHITVEDFRVVTPCSDVVGYQRFGAPCFLHLQGECWYPNATLPGIITQKSST